MNRSKRGSITIETAIAFTVTLCFITSVLTAVSLIRTDVLMQRAVSNTCEDFALLTPLSVTAADTVSTLTNMLPDGTSEEQDTDNATSLMVQRLSGFDIASDRSLTEAVFDLALSSHFEDDIAQKYVEYNDGSEFFLPDTIDVDFDIDTHNGFIAVIVSYSVDTIVGPVTMHVTDGIPFYGDLELFLNGSEDTEESEEDVWGMNNLDRGQWFEEHYGSNLPHTFPVINDLQDGVATSYLSIDLNRPTNQSQERVERSVTEEIDSLASFNGADVNIGGTSYNISASDIDSRRLVIVIPSNSPEDGVRYIEDLEDYAEANNVELVITTYGTS
ncbi:MAG: hypothetical protein K6F49_04855 [Saccharofermentans sp.]|nr:hypothetical protein [Saccharofermentans sp.]